MMNFEDENFVVDKQAIRSTELYSLHQVMKDSQKLMAKVFFQHPIKQYDLMEALDYNSEVLRDQYSTLVYSTYILPILKVVGHKSGFIFVTPAYDRRLDDYIKTEGGLSEQQVMKISEDILKAIYGLMMSGFFHRSIRPEHFVRHQGVWKLQSLVLNQFTNDKGFQSEYIWSNEHQPPQLYSKECFTQEELDLKVAWDFGNIVIFLLLGHHKLKNIQTFNKFKNEPFSFKRVGAKIGETYSKELKDILGQLCHYNQQKRMKMKELIKSGFFSKELSEDYKTRVLPEPRIYISGSSSASQTLNYRHNATNLPNVDAAQIQNNKKRVKAQSAMIQDTQKIKTNKQFKSMIREINQEFEGGQSSVMKKKLNAFTQAVTIQEIQRESNGKKISVIDQFKSYIDKGQILTISDSKLRKVLQLEKNELKAQQLLKLTKYALYFVKTMDLFILAKTMNNNLQFHFFDTNTPQWDSFHGTREYDGLRKLVNFRKQEANTKLNQIRLQILLNQEENLKNFSQQVKQFVNKSKASQSTFLNIKKPYRQILKNSYDLVADHYTKNKKQIWATIGMYLTFCIAIDKMYIPKDFKDNFKFYFEWMKQPNNSLYIPLESFQHYIQEADKQTLLENSTYIISKYFQV